MISDRGVFVEVDTSNTKIHILRQFKDFNFGFTSHGTTLFWTLIFRTYLDLLLLEQVELYTAVFNYNSTPKKIIYSCLVVDICPPKDDTVCVWDVVGSHN